MCSERETGSSYAQARKPMLQSQRSWAGQCTEYPSQRDALRGLTVGIASGRTLLAELVLRTARPVRTIAKTRGVALAKDVWLNAGQF